MSTNIFLIDVKLELFFGFYAGFLEWFQVELRGSLHVWLLVLYLKDFIICVIVRTALAEVNRGLLLF